jgi:hypothetical protein
MRFKVILNNLDRTHAVNDLNTLTCHPPELKMRVVFLLCLKPVNTRFERSVPCCMTYSFNSACEVSSSYRKLSEFPVQHQKCSDSTLISSLSIKCMWASYDCGILQLTKTWILNRNASLFDMSLLKSLSSFRSTVEMGIPLNRVGIAADSELMLHDPCSLPSHTKQLSCISIALPRI